MQCDRSWATVTDAWEEIQASRACGPIARTIGTEMRITLPLHRYEHSAKIEGLGGKGPDVSWVGVEVRSGLSGECSVGIGTTIHRRVCANGMVRPAADYKHRIRHTGGKNELDAEVRRILGTATDDLSSTIRWLEALGNREFLAKGLVGDPESMKLVRQMLGDLSGI